jgi:dephospho-CoA kinase
MSRQAITIGLTGGIGTGKSTVARILAELGAHVINADVVGHEIYQPHTPGWHQVVDAFGQDIVDADGSIDRRKLGQIVFNDPGALARLNAIVHPLIRAAVGERIEARHTARLSQPIVIEAAILLEARWNEMVDEVWVVVAGIDAVVRRIAAERNLSPKDIQARVAAQMPESERRRFADVVIENTGSPADLRRQVEAAWAKSMRDRRGQT